MKEVLQDVEKNPNMIPGVDLKLAKPWEVESRIEELLKQWKIHKKHSKIL